jgi:hypothetical protein
VGNVIGLFEELLDEAEEFYPGSRHAVVRHPNRKPDAAPDPDRWDAKPRILKVGGVDKEFFTVGQLALALGGRKPVTIRKWERTGVIPKPTFVKPSDDPRGQRRLYSREQVEGMRKIAEEEGVLSTHSALRITQTRFTERVISMFRELSVVQ